MAVEQQQQQQRRRQEGEEGEEEEQQQVGLLEMPAKVRMTESMPSMTLLAAWTAAAEEDVEAGLGQEMWEEQPTSRFFATARPKTDALVDTEDDRLDLGTLRDDDSAASALLPRPPMAAATGERGSLSPFLFDFDL
jgi:hypothetical protein